MGATMVFDLEVWFEDPESKTLARADQRDIAAFETEYRVGFEDARKTMPITFFRYLGWSALRRRGMAPASKADRDKWLDNVISVEPLDADGKPVTEDSEIATADPTPPAAQTTSTSGQL